MHLKCFMFAGLCTLLKETILKSLLSFRRLYVFDLLTIYAYNNIHSYQNLFVAKIFKYRYH